jgi:hypothetical protein
MSAKQSGRHVLNSDTKYSIELGTQHTSRHISFQVSNAKIDADRVMLRILITKNGKSNPTSSSEVACSAELIPNNHLIP